MVEINVPKGELKAQKRKLDIDAFEKRGPADWTIIRHEALNRIRQEIAGISAFDPNREEWERKLQVLELMSLQQFKECFITNLRSR